MKIGIMGCGNISAAYLKNLGRQAITDVVAVADIDLERARARATEFGVALACSPEELLGHPDIELIINLTVPKAHAEVTLAALASGKHVYSEKPLAVRFEDAEEIVRQAQARGLRVGVAPDTVLGAGVQTCRKLVDDGMIGRPVAANAFMLSSGPESWHPDPEFFYHVGAGPLFDMGPYYLSTFITLFGPVRRVTASAQISQAERLITSQPKQGSRIKVEVPTHMAGVLDFLSGPVVTLITSFDVPHTTLPNIEVYGTEGTLLVPDPNYFTGEIRVRRRGDADWQTVPLAAGIPDLERGLGVLDMVEAIGADLPHRANADIGRHVVELMHGFHVASATDTHYLVGSHCDKPAPMLP